MTEAISSRARDWMFRDALPLWADRGVDRRHGGYVEQLHLDGSDRQADFKRTRVTCRQMYVFSHAAVLGRSEYLPLAWHGFQFLTTKAWLGPGAGWARLTDRSGAVMDATPDLYDHAFVLFALGWFYRATGDARALGWSHRTLDFLDAHMRHSDGVGYLAEKPAKGPRRQNPHMHLLEAALVNLEASGDERFRALADEMVDLFSRHLFNPRTGTLAELFGEDWSLLQGEAGRTVEPGHHFEWAWLLAKYQRATGRDMLRFVRPLIEFAERHGVDPVSGAPYNAVRDDGVALDRNSRAWPNTERLMAAVALFELDHADPQPVYESAGRLLFDRYLNREPVGTWLDEFSDQGAPLSDWVPASTLYHLFIAFAEMLRVEAAVTRTFGLQDPRNTQ